MTATAHALVAGLIAQKFTFDPATAGLVAFGSHFLMDSIPHWDLGTNFRNRSKATTGVLAIAETIFGIILTYLIFSRTTTTLTLTVAIFFSELPDWAMTPWFIFFHRDPLPKGASWLEKICYWIFKPQNTWFHRRAELPLGAITQILTLGFFYLLIRA